MTTPASVQHHEQGADNDRWIEAIYSDRLSELTDPAVQTACAAIEARMIDEVSSIIAALADAGISASAGTVDGGQQRHAAELRVENATTARAAARVLTGVGFSVWEPVEGGAGRLHGRIHDVLTVVRTTDVTIAVRLRWPAGQRRLPRALTPNQADVAVAPLPGPLWPLYFAIRPLRLAAERLGLRSPAPPVLGPFLSTPNDIIPVLLALGEVGSGDTLADLGCGDGRVLIDAARRTGCRAIGIESDPTLVAEARRRVDSLGLDNRIHIIEGDAATAELGRATVVFVFLPADATVALVERLLGDLEPGTRIIAHEQHRLPRLVGRPTSTAVIAGQGVTVMHQWIAGR